MPPVQTTNEVQTMRSRTGKLGTVESRYSIMWAEDKLDRNRWWAAYCALLTGATNADQVAMAAELADQAYMELMRREDAGQAR